MYFPTTRFLDREGDMFVPLTSTKDPRYTKRRAYVAENVKDGVLEEVGGWGWGWGDRGGGVYSFVACLSHLTIDHASVSRWCTVPAPDRDTSNIWALITLFSIYYKKSVCWGAREGEERAGREGRELDGEKEEGRKGTESCVGRNAVFTANTTTIIETISYDKASWLDACYDRGILFFGFFFSDDGAP